MDLLTEKKVFVEGEEYLISTLNVSKAFKIGAQLAKLVGEPFAQASKIGGDEERAGDVMPIMIKCLMNNFHEDNVLHMVKELINTVTQNNKLLNFEIHFRGRIGHLIALTVEVIKFQFADFTTALSTITAEMKGKVVK